MEVGMHIAETSKLLLSKTTFMYGCQCHKRLWLHKYHPEWRDEESDQQATIFQRGTDVGLLAQQLLPGGVNASENWYDYQQATINTQRFIREGRDVIYEASFQYDGIFCAIDMLEKRNGKWYVYEVKSSTRVKSQFILDAAIQYFVLSKLGLEVEDIYITHLNSDYIRMGALNLKELFIHRSVKKEVEEVQPFVAVKAGLLQNILENENVPDIAIGRHCFKPYACDFFGHCSIGLPEEEPEDKYINDEEIKEFLKKLSYPVYFMDFETWITAVPECNGHWSYRQIPFQFSVHVQENAGGELKHYEYLAEHPHASLLTFAEKLTEIMGDSGSVLVYNKTFENGIMNALTNDYPELNERIENIKSRVVDLMPVFRSDYRLPEMNGSYSLKYVLPALIPDLTYDSLEISNGTSASTAFYNLQFETNQPQIELIREALLEYCKMDTLAMVRILERLRQG